nr:hypothetical protein [Tanacetum cinerariifolium]
MYDLWKSIMELYMLNRQDGRMILESVENGPLLWLTVEENGVTRLKKYSELSATEAIQAECDVKETNIILQGLPPEVYVLYASQAQSSAPFPITYPANDFQSSVNHNVYNPSSSIPQVEYAPAMHQQFDFPQLVTGFVVPGRQNSMTAGMSRQYTSGPSGTSGKQRVIVCYNSDDLDAYDSDCDEINSAKIALIANLSHYRFDNLAKSLEIDNLKHILSEYLKEKESLEQKVTV